MPGLSICPTLSGPLERDELLMLNIFLLLRREAGMWLGWGGVGGIGGLGGGIAMHFSEFMFKGCGLGVGGATSRE